MTPKKILLAGGYDTRNLGDHASLVVFGDSLRKKLPDVRITHLSRHPDKEFDALYNVTSIKNLDHETRAASEGRWFNGLNPGDITTHLGEIRKELESCNLVVFGSGRLFVDISLDLFRGPLPYFALLTTLAKFFQKPIMVFGMTIVPCETEIGGKLTKFIVSNADAITVREEQSKIELKKLGIPAERVTVLYDPALGLEYRDRKQEGMSILKKEGIQLSMDNLVAFSVRSLHTVLLGRVHEDESRFFKDLAQLCDNVIDTLDVDILFVAQQTYGVDTSLEDDRNTAFAVREKMRQKARAHVLRGEYNVEQTLALYQTSEFLISMRRHALAFAFTQRVPGVALSGDPSIDGFMQSTGQAHNIIRIQDMNELASLDKIEKVWEQRHEIREHLSNYVSSISRETQKYADIAWELIQHAGK